MAYSELPDSILIKRLSEDDREAFNELFARYWQSFYKSAIWILKDEESSKDIVQDVFIWLWEHRGQLNITSLKAYLGAAVKFKIANYIRSGKIRESFFEELAAREQTIITIRSEDDAELKEFRRIIQNSIDNLPPKCREIFLLSRDQHKSNLEIAQIMGISVKTVENQMTIALRRIRSSVEPYAYLLLLFSII